MSTRNRPYVPVLLAVTSLFPPKYHLKCYKLYRDNFYTAPEAKHVSWEKLCKFYRDYIDSKYWGKSCPDLLEYNDLEIARILRNDCDYENYLPSYVIKPFFTYDQFMEIINNCQKPVIHG